VFWIYTCKIDLALLYCYNCDRDFSANLAFFSRDWTTNFPIFGREKLAALCVIQHIKWCLCVQCSQCMQLLHCLSLLQAWHCMSVLRHYFIFCPFLTTTSQSAIYGFLITSPTGVVAKYCDEYVCLSVCLSVMWISPEPYARTLVNFLCMLPISVAQSSSGVLMTGHIVYRREGGDGSAQRGRSVICDCLVLLLSTLVAQVE